MKIEDMDEAFEKAEKIQQGQPTTVPVSKEEAQRLMEEKTTRFAAYFHPASNSPWANPARLKKTNGS